MAGTTIDGLNSVTSLTSQDEVPVWDAEASGEPTKKITAQNMTASVKTLGSLVNTSEMNSALAGKQNTLTFDTTPTTGSTNPVTSGGIADAITQSTATETLHLGTFNTVDATTQLSHPVTDYYFVLLDFRTNSEHTWQLIPTALLPIGNNQPIHATIVGNNTSGQITYPPSFNSSINVQFVTASTIKCTQSLYNNSNFRISLFGVYGLYKK